MLATTGSVSHQLWQWRRHGIRLADGAAVTSELVDRIVEEELDTIRQVQGEHFDAERYAEARVLLREVAPADELVEFLTLPAYRRMP